MYEKLIFFSELRWASLIAQLVKNLPVAQETPVWFPGWEGPLEKGKAPHTNILAWRIPWMRFSKKKKKKELRYLLEKNRFFIYKHGKDHKVSPPLWMNNEYTIFLNNRHQNKNFHQNKKLRNNIKNDLNSDYQFFSLQFRHQPNQ